MAGASGVRGFNLINNEGEDECKLCKTDRYDAHERIKNIGGDGWKHAEDDAISYIENNVYSHYVNQAGYEAEVIVAQRLATNI
jgi:hypothetical protein